MLLTECVEHHLITTVPVFADDDLAVEALGVMQAMAIDCAPVLHHGKVRAMVTLLDLLPAQQSNKRLNELHLAHVETIGLHDHLFETLARLDAAPSALVPVADDDGRYAGVVEKAALLRHLADIFHLGDDCATLELDVPSYDLKLSEIIAVIEKNDATVLSFGLSSAEPEGSGVVLIFRLQTHDLFRLVTNVKQYGYLIRYHSPFFRAREDEMREMALEVMRFIEM